MRLLRGSDALELARNMVECWVWLDGCKSACDFSIYFEIINYNLLAIDGSLAFELHDKRGSESPCEELTSPSKERALFKTIQAGWDGDCFGPVSTESLGGI